MQTKKFAGAYFFKFSILLLRTSILFKSWKRKKHKRRSLKLDNVTHFLLAVLLEYDLGGLFQEYEIKKDILKILHILNFQKIG